jgi:hypothetical protein
MTRDRVVLTAATFVAACCLLQLLHFGHGRDQGIYAAVARTMLDGGAPYRDAWDFKPPGIFFIYLLAGLLDSEPWAIRVVECLALGSLLLPAAYLARESLGDARAGVLSVAIALITHVSLEFWHTGQPESFGGVLLIWALALSILAERSTSTRCRALSWVCSGLLFGAAVVLKPTMAPAAVAPLLTPAAGRSPGWRMRAASLSLFLAGITILSLAAAAYFASVDAWPDLRAALFDFAPKYVELSWIGKEPVEVAAAAVSKWLFEFGLLHTTGLVLFLVFALRRLNRAQARILLATALLLPGIIAQAKFFGYHFGSILLLSSLIAGWGFWLLWGAVRERRFGVAVYALALMWLIWVMPSPDLPPFRVRSALRAVALIRPEERERITQRLYSVVDFDAAANADTAARIAAMTPRGSRVFVWGFTPNLYLLSERQASSRYIYNLPQRSPWSRDSTRSELIATLQAAPPEVIVVEHGDRVGHITGSVADSADELRTFEDLNLLLANGYRLVFSGTKFDIHEKIRRYEPNR